MENNQTKEKLLAEIERLKKELKKKKKYGLVWEEKPEDVVEMCKEKLPVLKEVKGKEIITDKNKPMNLLIEGDNYHALSVLNYTHKGKIDVIYIDPPYNTGKAKEWKYNDKYVDENDGYKHSKWLNMMEKRLLLAKNLLKKSGAIFISIDDNELYQLKLLVDKIFKENNFELMIWDKVTGNTNAGSGKMKITYRFRKDHEYIVCVYLNKNEVKFVKPLGLKEFKNEYGNIDNDPRGNWMSCEICKSEVKSIVGGKNYFTFKTPFKKEITRQWHYSKDELETLIKDNRIYFGNGNIIPRLKKFLNEEAEITPTSIIQNLASTTDGNNEGKEIGFNFENPKPSKFIKYLLSLIVSNNKNAIILDYFAGSGTTGHAVLALNKLDEGNRKFILCTNNENKICEEVTYPRVQKVIKGYKKNGNGEKVSGLGGNLKYFKTDFVDYKESTDRNKIRLTKEAVEMLCVKEGTFELVLNNEDFKIFKNHDHYAGIIFDQLAIEDFKKAIKDIKGKISVYIFSLGDDSFEDEFEDIKQKVKLSPIPEAILKVYRRIYK